MRGNWRENSGRLALLTSMLGGLGGCAHRDAVDTVGNWWHQYQGGAIAQQRPPPPGAHDSYPHVGLTPTKAPDMPSPQARTAQTDLLESQRNFGNRLAAADGPLPKLPAGPVHSATVKPAPSANSDSGSSMSVNAPEQSGAQASNMPAVTQFAPPPIKPGDLPAIGDLPPPAPQFPGFDIPRDANLADRPAPTYTLADPHGKLIRFAQASDQLVPGQEHDLGAALDGRGAHKPVYVTGFGETQSLSPSDQAASLRLGLLRAHVLADALVARGVPESEIHLAAGSFGHGGRISLTP